MAKAKSSGTTLPTPEAGRAAVETFIAELDHPHRETLVALRALILAADPAIVEGIKWNVPSFRTADWFATFHLRGKAGLGLILHFGARPRAVGTLAIADPAGLLSWLAPNRAQLQIADGTALDRHRAAITAIIRQWIAVMR